MKITYVGERVGGSLLVYVDAQPDPKKGGARRRALNMRLDLFNHSPSGFECGYAGSGPAQLALAICADHLKRHELRAESAALLLEDFEPRATICDRVAVRMHQDFKRVVVGNLPRDGEWMIPDEHVGAALDQLIFERVAAQRAQAAS